MIYRKSSPRPPTFLLRIAATAGASALLGTAGCSGADAMNAIGSIANPGTVADSGDEGSMGQGGQPTTGDDAGMSPMPCNGGPCGAVAMPPDSGTGPCNGGPCGVVVMPHDSGTGPCNGGPCGVVVMPHDSGAAPCDGPCGLIDAGQVITGVLTYPPDDAGESDGAHHMPIGILPIPTDASTADGSHEGPDAGVHGPCNGLPCGIIIRPDAGFGK